MIVGYAVVIRLLNIGIGFSFENILLSNVPGYIRIFFRETITSVNRSFWAPLITVIQSDRLIGIDTITVAKIAQCRTYSATSPADSHTPGHSCHHIAHSTATRAEIKETRIRVVDICQQGNLLIVVEFIN